MSLPGQKQVCSSTHSLATLSALINLQRKDGTPSQINVPQTCKESAHLDHYYGLCYSARFLPERGTTQLGTFMAPEMNDCHSIDPEDEDDFHFLRKRRPNDTEYLKKLDEVWKAEQLCRLSRKFNVLDPKRRKTLERAAAFSDMCARGHLMLFEIEASDARENGKPNASHEEMIEEQKEMIPHLYRAVEAGRRFKIFIGTDEFCKGNLFSYLPTRFYVRSVYGLGSILFALGDMEEAELYLKETLANDVYDKLGARHKQLLLNLERSGGVKGADIKYLLKATFGEAR